MKTEVWIENFWIVTTEGAFTSKIKITSQFSYSMNFHDSNAIEKLIHSHFSYFQEFKYAISYCIHISIFLHKGDENLVHFKDLNNRTKPA